MSVLNVTVLPRIEGFLIYLLVITNSKISLFSCLGDFMEGLSLQVCVLTSQRAAMDKEGSDPTTL